MRFAILRVGRMTNQTFSGAVHDLGDKVGKLKAELWSSLPTRMSRRMIRLATRALVLVSKVMTWLTQAMNRVTQRLEAKS